MALFKASLLVWHTFVKVFCSSSFSLSFRFLSSHSTSCFCLWHILTHTEGNSLRCGYIYSAGKKDNLLHPFYYRVQDSCSIMMARCEGSSLVCHEVIKNTQSAAQVQACGILHTDPPCEKLPVPRTQCVRLGGNNSPGPLTSSFGLLRFMTLSSAIQLLSPQLPFALIGLDRSLREEDEGEVTGKQLGWGGKLVWYGMKPIFIMAITDDKMDATSLVGVHILLYLPTTLQPVWWENSSLMIWRLN